MKLTTEKITDQKASKLLEKSECTMKRIKELSWKTDEGRKTKLPKTVDVVEFRRGVAFAVKEVEKGKSPSEILAMIQEA